MQTTTPPALPEIDFGSQVADVTADALTFLGDNVAYLFALPGAWVVYKIVRKIIAKIG